MRILHVVSSYLPARRYGGTIVSVHGLCKALAARGHDVHVFTTSVDGPRDSDVPHGVPIDMEGVTIWYFQSRRFRRIYRAPALAEALAARVAGFDVVHTHAVFLWPLWAAARAAHRAGVPYVVSPRGMLEKKLIERKSHLLKTLWITFVERQNLEQAAAIHVTSAREATELAAFGFDLPALVDVPNGVDLEGDNHDPPSRAIREVLDGAPYVLFLGRVSWKKGLDRLIAALAFAPSVTLVLAGNDEEGYSAALQRQAARLGVGSRIVFAGAVWDADKAALLTHAQALVLPSYSENFGNVVVEAMAVGLPVIVTPEVGIADVIRETGAGRVVEGDPPVLGAALVDLMGDPAARREMGERGRRIAAQRFTWDAVAARMEAAYESILARRRPSA